MAKGHMNWGEGEEVNVIDQAADATALGSGHDIRVIIDDTNLPRDEAAEGMTRVTEKLDMAQKLGNERILEIDNEVGGKRKELEAVRVELQNLQAKLAAA